MTIGVVCVRERDGVLLLLPLVIAPHPLLALSLTEVVKDSVINRWFSLLSSSEINQRTSYFEHIVLVSYENSKKWFLSQKKQPASSVSQLHSNAFSLSSSLIFCSNFSLNQNQTLTLCLFQKFALLSLNKFD